MMLLQKLEEIMLGGMHGWSFMRFIMFSIILRTSSNVCASGLVRFASVSSKAIEPVETSTEGKVRLIALNRPAQRNAVNRHTARRLFEAFKEFNRDESVHCAVLSGKGGNFCAGYDLKEVAASCDDAAQVLESQGDPQKMESTPAPMGPTHMTIEKPVIAAVSGYAVAGGLELALMCDLRVAEVGAVFGVFSRRFGVPLIDGGTVRLPALIGLSRALDIILTGRPVHAKEALEIGLANRVVEEGKSVNEALKLAHQITKFPQMCLRTDRYSALHSSSATQFKSLLSLEAREGMKVIQEESIVGAQRFAQGEGRQGKFD